MAEYIEREAVCYQLEKLESIDGQPRAIRRARKIVADFPAADVREVKRGKWIDMADFEQCSECKGTHLKEFQSYYGKTIWIKTRYCPNCGADMREAENA